MYHSSVCSASFPIKVVFSCAILSFSNSRAKSTAMKYTIFKSSSIKTSELNLSREGLILIALMSGSDLDSVRLQLRGFVS